MADRIHIPSSPACGQWETLLADALDGLLRAEDEATFTSHMASCAACTGLFEEARRGQEWLEFLSAEPEVPGGLLDKILAQTGPGQTAGFGLVDEDNLLPVTPGGIPLANKRRPVTLPAWQRPGFMGFVRRFAEPRLMMTAAMAFFSIALTLNLTGVKVSNLRLSDLKPAALRSLVQRRLTMASTPIIRYYDNLRLVYEVQSRVRELRRNNDDTSQPKQKPSGGPGESKQTPKPKDGGSKVDPPQQSVSPSLIDPDYLESQLDIDERPAHSGGSAKAIRGRSTVWIA
jgi:hypothetical protein